MSKEKELVCKRCGDYYTAGYESDQDYCDVCVFGDDQ